METKIAIFKGKKIRKTIHNNEWLFSVVDIIEVLTDSKKPRDYWYQMKKRVYEKAEVDLSTICRQLKLESADGKYYATDVVNKELERKSGKKIVTKQNYILEKPKKKIEE